MRTQTYFHTRYESEANQQNKSVPLQVNCAGAVSEERTFSNRSVRRDYYYLYVLEGRMKMADCSLEAGEVMIIEPGHHYAYQSEGYTTYLWVHFTGFEAGELARLAVGQPNVKKYIGVQEGIKDCFQKLFHEFIIHDEATEQLSVCMLKEILLLTGRYAKMDKGKGAPLKAIEYLHRHYRDDIGMEQLALLENVSCTTFRNIFRKHTGESPNEYLISLRITEACRLLTQTRMSVSEIAGEVGYSDPYYFSRLFKKKMGMPPLKYRNFILQTLPE